jgi:glycosyltransferase involved in cell wall biosynthesis
MKELISICSATHNQTKYLKDWYEGIMCQFDSLDTDKYDIEVCLVIDEKTERESYSTANFLWSMRWDHDYERNDKYFAKNNNFKIHINSENLGGPASMSLALSMATGQYITILEPDDYYKPGKLAKSLEFIEENNLDGVHGDVDCILPDGTYIKEAWSKTCWQEKIVTVQRLMEMNTIYTCSFLCKADLIRKAPSPLEFSKKFSYLGDHPLFAYLCYNGAKIGWMNESLSVYRDSVGINNKNREESVRLDQLVKEWIANGCKREYLTSELGNSQS